jgi:arylsulfatase A-like enzyme
MLFSDKHRTYFLSSILAPFLLLLSACSQQNDNTAGAGAEESQQENRPNILLIVADDLGYADLGFYGSEIPTPYLDALAANGMLLTDFYTSMTCSPTRAMLMSGTDNHLAGLGVMTGPTREEHMDQPGYVGFLNFRVASLADLMSDAGYNTYMTGKWHLGMDVENGPRARGFQKSFVSLDGAAHLGGWDWRGPQPANYRDGDELVQVGDDFYTTRFYTEKMLEYIDGDSDDGNPFFAYLAYTAPHWPLQAPKASIERFRGLYDEGYEALYMNRFERLKDLGHIPDNAEPMPMDIFNPRWADQPDEEKALAARRMEIYAAMVSDLDTYVGKVVNYLKGIGEFDNTFIMFMSDNGTESSRRDLAPSIAQHIGTAYDHSLDNLGTANSYVMYGANWATASAAPWRRHKFTGFEGGIHVPAFVHHPGLVEAGTSNGGFSTVMDVLPTFLALAGTSHPGTSYRGTEIEPVKGKSLLPLITGETAEIHTEDDYMGWELFGHRSVRQGDWKIVWDRAAGDNAKWLLFNLTNDISEQNDLSIERPDKLTEMIALWDRYEEDNGVIYVYPE